MVETEIAAYLAQQGHGTFPGTIFASQLPATPDAAVAVVRYAGEAPAFVHDLAGIALDRPRVQVLVRELTYSAAEARAGAICNTLARVANAALAGVPYPRITPLQTPFPLERDANGRVVFVCNYACLRAAAA